MGQLRATGTGPEHQVKEMGKKRVSSVTWIFIRSHARSDLCTGPSVGGLTSSLLQLLDPQKQPGLSPRRSPTRVFVRVWLDPFSLV